MTAIAVTRLLDAAVACDVIQHGDAAVAVTTQITPDWLEVEGLEVGDDEDFGSLLASVAPFGDRNGHRPAAGDGAAAVQDVADSLEPGSAVAFLLVEHLWAR